MRLSSSVFVPSSLKIPLRPLCVDLFDFAAEFLHLYNEFYPFCPSI